MELQKMNVSDGFPKHPTIHWSDKQILSKFMLFRTAWDAHADSVECSALFSLFRESIQNCLIVTHLTEIDASILTEASHHDLYIQ